MKPCSKRIVLPLAFLLPAAVMAAVFAACGLAPFGTRTMGVIDMTHQYLAFLYSLRDILAGRASLLYLPSMCLGGNMLGVAAYYLTSPLNLITCLFPREGMYTAVSVVYFLRVGLCGLTMCVYAGRRHGYSLRCLVPAMAYAFMAYMVGYCFNYLWQDCVILLPIVALGIARLCEGKAPWLYILALAGALFLNFYIGYILCIFAVLFFLYELFSKPRAERVSPWRTAGLFALSSLASGALAAVMLLPAFLSLMGGKAEFSLSVLTLAPKFDPVRLFSKFYIGAFDYAEIMPDGLPQVFCGTLTAALTVLYFGNRRIPRRRRVLTGVFFALLAVSFWITALDLIWHCLNTPSWYNYRYSFLMSFLMAAAADRELSALREGTRPWQLLMPVGLAAAVSVLVFAGRSYDYATWKNAAAAVGITAVFCLLLWCCLRPQTGRKAVCVLAAAILALHAGDLAMNAKLSLTELTATASDSAAYARYTAAKGAAFYRIDTEGMLVRTESPVCFDLDRCEPMLFGYDGVSHYGSTISQKSLDFLDQLGLDRYSDLWAMYGPGVTGAADTLLGIRYIVSQTPVRDYAAAAEAEGYTVWENPYALPAGWTADEAVTRPIAAKNSFGYTDALLAAAAPEVGADIFTPAQIVSVETEGLAQSGDTFSLTGEAAGSVIYSLTAPADGAMYAELSIPDQPSVMLYVNGAFCTMYATAQSNGTVYLGRFAAGDAVTVKLQTFADIRIESAAFASESAEALSKYHDAISAGGCPLRKLSASHYTGSFVTGEGDKYLVFTLPYDGSWRVLLDGMPVQPLEAQECLMAIPVAAGGHTVELRYIPAGLIPGAVVSAGTVLLCAAAYILARHRRKA